MRSTAVMCRPSATDLRVDHEPGHSVTVRAGDVDLFTYLHVEPTLRSVRTLAGEPVPAVSWTPPHVGGHPRLRAACDDTLTELTTSSIAHRLTWNGPDGAPVLDEWRALTAHLTGDDSWVLLFENTLTNVSGSALTFGVTGGGLRWQGALSFAGDGPYEIPVRQPAAVVVVDDDANPQQLPLRSAGGQTVAFRHAAVIATGQPDISVLAESARATLIRA